MATVRPRTVRNAFVFAVAVALGVFIFAQVLDAIAARGPEARLLRLMPAIGAERVQRDLTEEELAYPLETDSGAMVTLADLPRDTTVFLNFWATWCKPCRDELPSMLRLRREMANRRFIMVAVSYDEDWESIRDFFQRFTGGLPSPAELWILRDPRAGEDAASADADGTLRKSLGTTALPDSYVLYNDHVLERFVNAREWTHDAILDYFRSRAPAR